LRSLASLRDIHVYVAPLADWVLRWMSMTSATHNSSASATSLKATQKQRQEESITNRRWAHQQWLPNNSNNVVQDQSTSHITSRAASETTVGGDKGGSTHPGRYVRR